MTTIEAPGVAAGDGVQLSVDSSTGGKNYHKNVIFRLVQMAIVTLPVAVLVKVTEKLQVKIKRLTKTG